MKLRNETKEDATERTTQEKELGEKRQRKGEGLSVREMRVYGEIYSKVEEGFKAERECKLTR